MDKTKVNDYHEPKLCNKICIFYFLLSVVSANVTAALLLSSKNLSYVLKSCKITYIFFFFDSHIISIYNNFIKNYSNNRNRSL